MEEDANIKRNERGGGGKLGQTETLRRWDWSQTVSRWSRVFWPPWGSNSIWQHWKDGGSALIPAGALSLYTFKIWPAIPLSPALEMQEPRLHLSFHGTEGTGFFPRKCVKISGKKKRKKETNGEASAFSFVLKWLFSWRANRTGAENGWHSFSSSSLAAVRLVTLAYRRKH